jgi:hypothetical protein
LSDSTHSTERLIESLGADLVPTRPLPRLRSAFAIVLTVWASIVGLLALGTNFSINHSALIGSRFYLGCFVGLVIAALGGTASALAAGVPGRERLEVAGVGIAAFGLFAGALACLIGIRTVGIDSVAPDAARNLMCFEEGAFLSLLPAGVILSFLVRGWTARPFRAALIALLGSGALGALIIHLSCGLLAPKHLILGHMSVPIVLMVLGVYPVAVVLKRMRK